MYYIKINVEKQKLTNVLNIYQIVHKMISNVHNVIIIMVYRIMFVLKIYSILV